MIMVLSSEAKNIFIPPSIDSSAGSLNLLPRSKTSYSNDESLSKVLSIPFTKHQLPVNSIKNSIHKRAESSLDEISLINAQTFYIINMTIGSTNQNVGLLIDTGSSDTWVVSSTNPYCESKKLHCSDYGTFNEHESTSFKVNNSVEFSIKYGDGSSSTGEWGTDNISIPGTNIKLNSFSFAVGLQTDSDVGVLGIGYKLLETTYTNTGNGFTYDNFPIALVKAGLIESNAYSLYLNDPNASEGSILFGAIDEAKFVHPLVAQDVLIPSGISSPYELKVLMTGIQGIGASGNDTFFNDEVPVLLDSGTTAIYAPSSYIESIMTKLGAVYSKQAGAFIIENIDSIKYESLKFQFFGVDIIIELKNLVSPLTYNDGSPVKSSKGNKIYIIQILPQGGGEDYFVLGDAFLTSVYAVYDLDNNQVSLAQAIANSTDSNIKLITNGKNGIPNDNQVSQSSFVMTDYHGSQIAPNPTEKTINYPSGSGSASGAGPTTTSNSISAKSSAKSSSSKGSGSSLSSPITTTPFDYKFILLFISSTIAIFFF